MDNEMVKVDDKNAAETSVILREQAEIQAEIISAKKFPRDEEKAYNGVERSFGQLGMAEMAQYSFPRGGSNVKGPSINLAKELARLWGNTKSGVRMVSNTDEQIHLRGYARDLETNSLAEVDDIFKPLIQRKNRMTGKTEWVTPDERDLRELVNRRGAIVWRNAILAIMPPDLIELACAQAEQTLRRGAKKDIEDGGRNTKSLVAAFSKFGVTLQQVEAKLGHPLSDATPEELADLRTVYAALRDGISGANEYFDLPPEPDKNPLADKLAKANGALARAATR